MEKLSKEVSDGFDEVMGSMETLMNNMGRDSINMSLISDVKAAYVALDEIRDKIVGNFTSPTSRNKPKDD